MHKVLTVDQGWAGMLGYSTGELDPHLDSWMQRIHPLDRDAVMEAFEAHLAAKSDAFQAEYRLADRTGGWVWVHSSGKVTSRSKAGRPLRVTGINLDISARMRRDSEMRTLYTALDQSPVAMVVTTPEPRIVYVNPAFTELSGYRFEDVVGMNPRILQSGRTNKEEYQRLWQTITQGEIWAGEFWNRRKDGALRLEQVTIAPVKDVHGAIVNYIATKEDITQRRHQERQIWKQANFDALTGLANRGYFLQSLDDALHRARRNGRLLAVLFIDLDLFKPINDTYGHEAGDQLLQRFAQRLGALLRESDILGRLGGDEFAVVIEGLDEPITREFLQEKLERTLCEPYAIVSGLSGDCKPVDVVIGTSIGLAHYPQDGETLDSLMAAADSDMYRIKAEHHCQPLLG